jgi:hypothetical protein
MPLTYALLAFALVRVCPFSLFCPGDAAARTMITEF